MTSPILSPAAGPPAAIPAAQSAADRPLRAVAQRLESAFLAEILKAAGLGKPRDSMGGGVGEEQFASFLREAQAKAMTARGGIGLSESLFHALKEGTHAPR